MDSYHDNKTIFKARFVKTDSEWWTPSEAIAVDAPSVIRLSKINIIGKSKTKSSRHEIYLSDRLEGSANWVVIPYDTPEHRDEDFERLKLALNINE